MKTPKELVDLIRPLLPLLVNASVYLVITLLMVVISAQNGSSKYGWMFIVTLCAVPIVFSAFVYGVVGGLRMLYPPTPPTKARREKRTPVYDNDPKKPRWEIVEDIDD